MSSYWITSGENGTFYIADNEDFVIKKVDHQANIIRQLGQGNGSGPGEVLRFNEMDPASQLQRTADTKILNDQMHFLITEFRDEKRFQNVVDVYHLDTGNYLYSYQLPESLYTFSITDNFLAGILLDTQELIIWETNVDEI